jgi:hypothetical protein
MFQNREAYGNLFACCPVCTIQCRQCNELAPRTEFVSDKHTLFQTADRLLKTCSTCRRQTLKKRQATQQTIKTNREKRIRSRGFLPVAALDDYLWVRIVEMAHARIQCRDMLPQCRLVCTTINNALKTGAVVYLGKGTWTSLDLAWFMHKKNQRFITEQNKRLYKYVVPQFLKRYDALPDLRSWTEVAKIVLYLYGHANVAFDMFAKSKNLYSLTFDYAAMTATRLPEFSAQNAGSFYEMFCAPLVGLTQDYKQFELFETE